MQRKQAGRATYEGLWLRGLGGFAVFVALYLGLSVSPAFGKEVVGFFGGASSSGGSLGGEFNQPRDVAVNRSGAGPADAGDTYVVDDSNHRIQRFDDEGNFISAWGVNVVTPAVNEIQTLTVAATTGTYTLTFEGATTAAIAFSATNATVDSALGALTTIGGAANVTVTGGPGNAAGTTPYTITFTAGLSATNVPELVANTASLTGTATPATTTQGVGAYEICTVAANCRTGAATGGANVGDNAKNGSLDNPQSIAIDDDTGNIYVSDRDNRRVNVYDGAGSFIRSFGFGVDTTTAGDSYEICPAANRCRFGIAGAGVGQIGSIATAGTLGIAVSQPDGNPSTGKVFLADSQNRRVNTYNLDGTSLSSFGSATQFPTAGQPRKIAVDSRGIVYASSDKNSGEIERYDSENANGGGIGFLAPISSPPLLTGTATTATSGLAIDPDSDGVGSDEDVLYVLRDPTSGPTVVHQFGPINDPGLTLAPASADGQHGSRAGFSIVNGLGLNDASGRLYVTAATNVPSVGTAHRVYVLDTALPDPSVTFQSVSDITAHSATVSGFVNPNGFANLPFGNVPAQLTTTYQFQYKRSADPDSAFVGVPAAAADIGGGTTNVLVSQKLGGLEAGISYDVRLTATKPFLGTVSTAIFTFATPAAPAEVGIPSATTAATETGARAALWGSVNPNSKPTTYRFEYGDTADYGTKAPALDESVGSGPAKVPVAQFVDGLEPDTTYHFRIVAKNVNGTTASPDRTFTTPPLGSALPENRGAELVSPSDKGPSGSVATFTTVDPQVWNQAAEDGNAIVYPIQNGIPDSTAGGWTRWHASRTASGWLSAQISSPSLIAPPKIDNLAFAVPSRVPFASLDTRCAVVQSYNPLTPDTSQQSVEFGVENLYLWRAAQGYELITDQLPLNPELNPNSPLYTQIEAADDCSRVYFKSLYQLTAGGSGIYEWDEGVLRDAGTLPNGLPGNGAAVGGEIAVSTNPVTARWSAVSPDGSRFFFSAISNEGLNSGKRAVFMRANGGAEVIDVSQSQTAVPTTGARFEAASPDGSRVFFLANYGIAGTSSSGPTNDNCGADPSSSTYPEIETKACDLYAYDVESGELTDLSADANPADSNGAAVQGAVAIDEDGSHVYFAALGQLIPGEGRTYVQNIAGEGSANIYLAHGGELSYVTTLNRGTTENGDLFGGSVLLFGGGGVLMRRPNRWSAETTADGSKLLFESSRNLTGYDSNGPEPDSLNRKAVYLYSAETGEITCVSCPLDGSPTLVTRSGKIAEGDAKFPLMLARFRHDFLTHRPSSMSEDGSRVFFTSPDALAPGAVTGKRNVYEWVDGQLYFLAIAQPSGGNGLGEYLDASASGDDVFIATKEQLAPQDNDFVADVYDLRVNGGFPDPPPTPPCQVDESVPLVPGQIYCQGDSTPQPSAPTPASPGFIGPGNPPVKKPCPKGKVRRRGKCVKRHKSGDNAAKRKRSRAAKTDRGGVK